TPWSDELIPFEEAAEIGTTKVIREHSTVGMLITTDGTFGDIPRESYIDAEKRIADELKRIGKPFVIILNSAAPDSDESERLALELEKNYNAPVALINCMEIDFQDISHILEMLLYEFPINELTVKLPTWLSALDRQHKLIKGITDSVLSLAKSVKNLNDASKFINELRISAEELLENIFECRGCSVFTDTIDIGTGNAAFNIELPEEIYYKVLCEETGLQVNSQNQLISVLRDLATSKAEFDKYSKAINELEENGYGIVLPDINSMKIEEPQIIRQAGSYGVKLKASATSVHMIRATIQTEINPIVGTEEQSEELIRYIMDEFEDDPKRIWESNIFGKSLYELLNDGLHTKLSHLSDESKDKLSETLSRVINEGSGGLICIIL
ncbi:MAG: stage IV sporulation protein A, partial [Lachnospiraceae bacterium]|nr:stage IV sporulation protein A [Lachnospiraceae bacterium]